MTHAADRHPRPDRSGRSSATRCRSSGATNWCRPARPARSGCTAWSPTVPAHRCPTRCWRSGRPTPTARSRPPPARCAATAGRSPAGAAPAPTATGHYSFTTVEPGATAPGFGAVHRGDGVRPRTAQPAVHPRLPARRPAGGRSAAGVAARRAPRHPDRDRATSTGCGSTSDCRAHGRDRVPALPGTRPMTDLFWPGDHRAGDADERRARSWRPWSPSNRRGWAVLVDAGVAPPAARADLAALVPAATSKSIAVGAEADGNPVIGLVALLRRTRGGEPTARWLHRGLTSQDVVDTALMLCLRDALSRCRRRNLRTQVARCRTGRNAQRHTDARAHADPARAAEHRRRARWPTGCPACSTPPSRWPDCGRAARPGRRCGGNAGRGHRVDRSADGALALTDALAAALGLAPAPPWHTTRSAITRDRRRAGHAAATRGGTSPPTSRPAADPRSASWPKGRRRRLVDHAAQEQSGAVGADPPGRADRGPAGGDAAHRVGGERRRALRRRAGTPSGRPCARWPGAPSSPPRRPANC